MKRTGEIVLGVISAIFSLISIILISLLVIGASTTLKDEGFNAAFESQILTNPAIEPQDIEYFTQNPDVVLNMLNTIGWVLVTAIIISLVLNIIGIVSIAKNKKPRLAGIMFILAGVLAGVISLTSILLYVAAILCFVRKPPVEYTEQDGYYSVNEPL
ncbi:DUF4064 domain-containing protein [Psychrobacillus glaciei]|uniref:DUF4064 domain-containing protein n=1 Tax=Psychrobacillus glaciei TaxID=2283160 RepID=A0A5J6SSV2_9BACI|nr:DUF4064 domain-containing protein [Psychrobacillus glaciei]QFG00533.1 DUF4064 domain-containing protein [Psychrobacillus glaciei]